jgi:hypothetical protein
MSMVRPRDAEAILATLAELQLVRYAYQLTMHGRGMYVPGGDDLTVNRDCQRRERRRHYAPAPPIGPRRAAAQLGS